MPRDTGSSSEIQSLVESFSSQLAALVRQSTLDRIHAALGDEGSVRTQRTGRRGRPAGTRAGRRAGRVGRASAGGKRSPEELERMSGDLMSFIKKNPGQRGEQIAAALRTDVKTMRLPMLKLIADKKLKTKGQRRGMTYFAS
jgi:hypothetical protein